MQSSTSSSSSSSITTTPHVDIEKFEDELPIAHFMEVLEIRKWQGFWLMPKLMEAALALRLSLKPRNDDVFLASSTKTGTTWLKSLTLCIMQRQNHQTLDNSHDVLTKENPHFLVPTIEAMDFWPEKKPFDLHDASAARLLHTHLPYALLPDSIKNSACKIVYIARNPNDTVISSWHYFNSFVRQNKDQFPLESMVDCFCSGVYPFGPFVEHVAEYWEESKKRPQKILFLKYEELRHDPRKQVLKIAEFLERPFEDEGEVDEIVGRCSFERLKNLEVNKNGALITERFTTQYSSFFRKGVVGDSKNYLTPEMEMQIDQTIRLKLEALGLFF